MQTTKLLALSLAIIISPKVAMKDLVGSFARPKAESATASKVEAPHTKSQASTTPAAPKPANGHSGHTCTCRVTPKVKGRWGSPRRVSLVRRPFSKAWLLAAQSPGFPLDADSASSFSNWSAVSGLANR